MRKSDIKSDIKDIIASLKCARVEMEDYIKPYHDIGKLLDKIENIEEENMIDTDIIFEDAKANALRSCLEENSYMEDIDSSFEGFIADLENWQEEVSKNKSEEIQEKYIDVINEIREQINFDEVNDEEDLVNQLFDVLTSLEEWEI